MLLFFSNRRFYYFNGHRYHDIAIRDIAFSAGDGQYWVHEATGNFTSNGHTFSPKEQMVIVGEGCAAWHITLVMSQVRWIKVELKQGLWRVVLTRRLSVA